MTSNGFFQNGDFSAWWWPTCNGKKRILDNLMQLKSLLLWLLSLLFTRFHVETFRASNFRIQKVSLLISGWVRVYFDFLSCSLNVDYGKFYVFEEIMVFLFKIFAGHYCVGIFHISLLIIQCYSKACFCLIYILFFIQNALH